LIVRFQDGACFLLESDWFYVYFSSRRSFTLLVFFHFAFFFFVFFFTGRWAHVPLWMHDLLKAMTVDTNESSKSKGSVVVVTALIDDGALRSLRACCFV
jgi:hypothetical protein